jgi:hypothetical protein
VSHATADHHRERRFYLPSTWRFARGQGTSLQEAADDLIHSILGVLLAIRSSGFSACTELQPDLDAMNFFYELGEIAASGGDIRSHVFG